MPAIGGAAAKFSALSASVTQTTQTVVALGVAATNALPALTNVELALKSGSTFAAALRDAMEGTGWRATQGGTPTAQQTAYAQQTIAQLTDLEHRLQAVFGTNNQFAVLIDQNIQKIAAGGDPGDAIKVLQALLGAYGPGLQQEMFSTDPAIAALAAELERFINSGMLT